jgi:hypothetical protein
MLQVLFNVFFIFVMSIFGERIKDFSFIFRYFFMYHKGVGGHSLCTTDQMRDYG